MDFSVTVSPFIHDEAMENVTFNNSRGIRIDLPVSRMHLHLEYCLMGGQAFHWVLTGIKQWYLCTYILAISVILNLIISILRSSAIGNYLVTLFEVDDRICFSLHSCENCLRKLSLLDYQVFYDFFVDYFRLNVIKHIIDSISLIY